MTVYEKVTQRIIEQLENGVVPWRKTWTGQLSVNWVTGKPYKGLNRLLLDGGEYITYKQCVDNKGKVKKGAKAHLVIFWKWYNKETEKDGKCTIELLPVLRYYTVFHISDCIGIESKYVVNKINTKKPFADEIIQEYTNRSKVGFKTQKGLQVAYYSPTTDEVVIPDLQQFETSESYYSVAFHELVHSTGHKSRLDRIRSTSFGSQEYSTEELTAEIGSSMLMAEMGIEMPETFQNSVSYIDSWLNALKGNSHMIVNASAKAEKAVELIIGREV